MSPLDVLLLLAAGLLTGVGAAAELGGFEVFGEGLDKAHLWLSGAAIVITLLAAAGKAAIAKPFQCQPQTFGQPVHINCSGGPPGTFKNPDFGAAFVKELPHDLAVWIPSLVVGYLMGVGIGSIRKKRNPPSTETELK